MNRFVAAVLCVLVTVAIAVACPPDEEPPVVPPDFDITWAPGTVIEGQIEVFVDHEASERIVNEEAFETLYLPLKERLFEDHAGKWIAIVGGEMLPRDTGGWFRPADDLAGVLAAADAKHPDARHRFVFRIGEEGDVRYDPTLSSKANIIGRQFLQQLKPRCFVAAGSGVWISPRGERGDPDMFRIGRHDDTEGEFLSPAVATIGDENGAPIEFHVATGYGGFTILSLEDAARLGLARWEVPGRVHAMGFAFRRAGARFRLEAAQVDETLPVAVRMERWHTLQDAWR